MTCACPTRRYNAGHGGRELGRAAESHLDPVVAGVRRPRRGGGREEVLDRTWKALAEYNAVYHAALLLRIEQPEMPSQQMAAELTIKLGKPINAALVRKSLQRAHDKFADLLLDEVATSLEAPN